MTKSPQPPRRARHLAVMAILLLFTVGGLPVSAQSLADARSVAVFEGTEIDLTDGWGDARACLVLPATVQCFRTIEELNAAEARLDVGDSRLVSTSATCSTALRLYDGTYQTGSVLSITVRGQWVNLGTYGFDNRTSSYRVGACTVELASGTNGGGSRYYRCLTAYCEEDVMASGWDNVLSSAYLK